MYISSVDRVLNKKIDVKKLLYAIGFLILGVTLNVIGIEHINTLGTLPKLYDTTYSFIPYIPYSFIIAETLIAIAIVIFFVYLHQHNKLRHLHHYIFMIAIFETLRGILIVLTPVDPLVDSYGYIRAISYKSGMFPSGHIALPFFFFLFTNNTSKKYSRTFLFVTIIVGLGLLAARAHYSIDIVGSLFIIFTIVTLYERFIA